MGITSFNTLGTSVETAELSDGAVTYDKLGNDLFKGELVETITFNGTTSTETTATLPTGYKQFIILFEVSLASAGAFNMRVNGSSTGYRNHYRTTSITFDSDDTEIRIYGVGGANITMPGMVIINANTRLSTEFVAQIMCQGANNVGGIMGQWTAGDVATDLTTITFVGSSNITGQAKIYGVL